MNHPKLKKLAEIEGFVEVLGMLEKASSDGVSPGICKNPGCDYTTEVEPDSDSGWCEVCQENSVVSALMLAGVI